uniref:Uncharacterized protein n=1 Tax=Aegilops tauschii subsp. strangulata TaxID=200361 RepID=A0A453RN57_AEGTS
MFLQSQNETHTSSFSTKSVVLFSFFFVNQSSTRVVVMSFTVVRYFHYASDSFFSLCRMLALHLCHQLLLLERKRCA